MKKILLSFLFFIVLIDLSSQEVKNLNNREIIMGSNCAFYGSGDVYGANFYGAFILPYNDYLKFSPRVFSGSASKNNHGYIHSISSFGLDVSVLIVPFPKKLSGLNFSVGPLVHRFVKVNGKINEQNQYDQYLSSSSYYKAENLIGLTGALSLEIIHIKKLDIGFRSEILTSFSDGFNCDSWQMGIFSAIKF